MEVKNDQQDAAAQWLYIKINVTKHKFAAKIYDAQTITSKTTANLLQPFPLSLLSASR